MVGGTMLVGSRRCRVVVGLVIELAKPNEGILEERGRSPSGAEVDTEERVVIAVVGLVVAYGGDGVVGCLSVRVNVGRPRVTARPRVGRQMSRVSVSCHRH